MSRKWGGRVNKQIVAAGFSPTGKTSVIYATPLVPPHDRARVFRTILSTSIRPFFCRKTAVACRHHGFRVGIK